MFAETITITIQPSAALSLRTGEHNPDMVFHMVNCLGPPSQTMIKGCAFKDRSVAG